MNVIFRGKFEVVLRLRSEFVGETGEVGSHMVIINEIS